LDNIHRVAVATKANSGESVQVADELVEWLQRRGIDVALDDGRERARCRHQVSAFSPHETYELVVVLGGDGTLLSVARHLTTGTPILGVNLGTLGFLTEINRSELYPALVEVLAGRFSIERRSLLSVTLKRLNGETILYQALNDVVITKSALARIIQLEVRIADRLVASYRSDGLIISTPTGSTAYNLSAGGPILHPDLPVAALTPICPHTLTMRPLVVPQASDITVTLESPHEEVHLTVDGQEGTNLEYRDKVSVTAAPFQVQLVKLGERTFYDALRSKLRWGE
jgi:NAD+ kinase